jgi:uncharacterized protein (DUF3820 family)
MSDLIKSNEIITFGKYKSQNINDILKTNPSYCQWALNHSEYLNEDQKKIINNTIKTDDIFITFGKYKGKSLKWIVANDNKYTSYLKNNEYVKHKMSNLLEELNKIN